MIIKKNKDNIIAKLLRFENDMNFSYLLIIKFFHLNTPFNQLFDE